MERRKKILLTAAIIATGLVLALQFQKSEFVSHFSSTQTTNQGTPAEAAGNHAAVTTPQAKTASSPSATAFDGRIEAAPGSSPGTAANPANVAGDNFSQASAPGPMVDMNAPEQTHTIVDGDTLQNLAQHYLGRSDRYMELFQYNRNVLRNPDELPIGAELRIPSQVALPTTSGSAALPAAPMTPISPLLPLPQIPTAPPASGKTTLPASAKTTAAPQQPGQRTYTVQAGDNLVDIARKFYGDGRRYESLYEANRRVMHNPTDLKPGMVLVVP